MNVGEYIVGKFGNGKDRDGSIYEYFEKNGLTELGDDGNIACQLAMQHEFIVSLRKQLDKMKEDSRLSGDIEQELRHHLNQIKEIIKDVEYK